MALWASIRHSSAVKAAGLKKLRMGCKKACSKPLRTSRQELMKAPATPCRQARAKSGRL